ncbi:SprT-like domain-containing protein, putative, partial [Hepatocystis sp. ex Piliocolobus tephrosceles]
EDTEFPDLNTLFSEYNETYFYNKLDSVQVKWSNKMKLCAGICVFKRSGYCCIRLSLPLLKLRKIKEYRETLLHEMIHAFLFLTRKNSKHDGHGPEFKKHMYRINKATGLCITIYHSFHDEVNFYRNHVWRCTGVCRTYPPHFGFVKRSMNRPPGPKEKWWQRHSSFCRGKFVKIEENETEKNKEFKDTLNKVDIKNLKDKQKGLISTKKKNKKVDTFEKRSDNLSDDLMNDAIIIFDTKNDSNKEKTIEEDELDVVKLIQSLFNNNTDNVLSFPNISIDYHKAFKSQNYFEID